MWMGRQHVMLQKPFSSNATFTDVQVARAVGINIPPYQRCWFFNFGLITISTFSLWPRGHSVHEFQKQFTMWTCQKTTLFHFVSGHGGWTQMSSGSRQAGSASGWCLYMTLALHGGVWTCTCRCSNKVYPLQNDVFFFFFCSGSAAWWIEGRGIQVLVLGLAVYLQKFV